MTTLVRTAIAAAAAALITPAFASADVAYEGPTPEEVAHRTADLDAAEAKWTAAGHRDYSFKIRRYCFCFEPYTRPAQITVTDGHASGGGKSYRKINEVNELFDFIRDHLEDHELLVRYGARLGVPKAIDTNPSFNVFDEEVGYVVRHFTVAG